MKLVFYLMIVAFCLPTLLDASLEDVKKPGLKIRMTRKGFQYATKIGKVVLNQQIMNVKFPNISLKINQGPGKGEVNLNNLRIDEFDSPEFSYALRSPDQVLVKSKGGKIKVVSEWHAWYKVLVKIPLSGQIIASADDIELEIGSTVKLPAGDELPRVNVSTCSAQIGNFELTIGGGVIQWIVNLFRHQIAARLKTVLEQQICSATGGILQDYANAEIRSLPTIIPVYKDFYLHYGMTSQPIVTGLFIETKMRSEITWRGQTTTPVEPERLPRIRTRRNPKKMLQFVGSDFILNSFFYSAHTNKAIQFALLPSMLPPKLAGFLDTSCQRMCLGKVVPQLNQKFPNSTVDLHLYTISPPKTKIQPNGAVINASAYADVYASPMMRNTIDPNLIFRIQVELGATLSVYVRDGHVAGNMTVSELQLSVIKSNVGTIPPQAMQILMQILRPALQDLCNFQFSKGIKIPTIEGVGLASPTLRLLERAVLVETDIAYQKTFPSIGEAKRR